MGFCSTRSTQIADSRSSGTFKQPLFTDGTKTTCNGVQTVDGTRYYADKAVLAAGAWSPTLIDLEDQCVSKVSPSNHVNASSSLIDRRQAWVFAHIQLTPTEAAQYKDSPVIYDGDYGFFFEPNE